MTKEWRFRGLLTGSTSIAPLGDWAMVGCRSVPFIGGWPAGLGGTFTWAFCMLWFLSAHVTMDTIVSRTNQNDALQSSDKVACGVSRSLLKLS